MTDAPPSLPDDDGRLGREAARWRARSQRVRLARRLLPILIVVLAGGVVAWVALRTVISGAERNAETRQEQALVNAVFHGQDDQGRSFLIGAKGATRDPTTGRYRLIGPVLRLNLGGRKVTEMTADGGEYDQAAKTVTIGPNVRIADGESGFTLVTPEAVMDTETGTVTGDKGIEGTGPLGTLKASAYVIEDQGERIRFRGMGDDKVRGVINPAGSDR